MKFFLNAISNIINGSANAIFALVLPPLLITKMSLEEYALWSYCLQTGAIIGYLNLGVQTAVGRYVALYIEGRNTEGVLNVIRTADKILYIMFVIGLCVSIALYLNIDSLVDITQENLILLAPQVIFIVSIGYCFSLLLNSYSGYFVGIRSNHVPMWINLVSKVLLGVLVVYFAESGLLFLSLLFLLINILTYILSFVFWKREAISRYILRSSIYVEKSAFIKFCLGLSVWNLGMLLVTGINSTIVGYFSFQHVAYFTIANGLVMALIGFASTGLNPLIQIFTSMHAKRQTEQISKIIINANNALSVLMLTAFVIYHLLSSSLFSIWLNDDYALPVASFVDLLIVSACFRVLNVPYALALIATGNQSRALLGALVEGGSNVLLSIVFCLFFGVETLPYAMILSSIVGTTYNIVINIALMNEDIPVFRTDFVSLQSLSLIFGLVFYYFIPMISYILMLISIVSLIYSQKSYLMLLFKTKGVNNV
jgi:O-antigen/teichoic acid export membrane protein